MGRPRRRKIEPGSKGKRSGPLGSLSTQSPTSTPQNPESGDGGHAPGSGLLFTKEGRSCQDKERKEEIVENRTHSDPLSRQEGDRNHSRRLFARLQTRRT